MGWLPERGDVVLGKYRVERALGEGGMGVVFEAVNVATDGRVALKMLKPSHDGGSDRAARMDREARASAKLKSRFVARILDFDQTDEGTPFLVMELLEGHDLSAELRRHAVLSLDDTLSYIIQACAGVSEAHALGIIHRDLKPGNLFLEPTAGGQLVRVLDFGLSKDLARETGLDLTAPSEALGTLAYMSPEQIRGAKNVGPPTDVWGLGIVLYRCLMGRAPLSEKGYGIATRVLDARPMPRVERDGVPPEVVAIIARALEKDPGRRFADARALGQALRPFVRRVSPPTKLAFEELGDAFDDERTSIMPPPPRRRPRRRSWLVIAYRSQETRMVLAGSAILALATVLIAATNTPRPRAPAPMVVATPLPSASTAASAKRP